MILYECSKCGEKFRGGAEDKICPLCGGILIIRRIFK